MTNLEKNFDKMFDVIQRVCYVGNLNCIACPFNCKGSMCKSKQESLEWLLSEYKEPKYKLTKFEYDFLDTYYRVRYDIAYLTHNQELVNKLECEDMLTIMLGKGYFKGIDFNVLSVKEVLENCEVEE